jgi:CheY-like chemotaxis protein
MAKPPSSVIPAGNSRALGLAGNRRRRRARIPAGCNARRLVACNPRRITDRCLIVDDSEAFLEAARTLLEREGLPVAGVASTREETLEQAEALQPDVVLIDVSLGAESGVDLARVIGHDRAVILISTRAEDEVVDLFADAPVAGFLTKSELSAEAVRRLLRRRRDT